MSGEWIGPWAKIGDVAAAFLAAATRFSIQFEERLPKTKRLLHLHKFGGIRITPLRIRAICLKPFEDAHWWPSVS